MAQKLDNIDLIILNELQRDGRITNVELARRAGISAPACLRRMRALEKGGAITGYCAILEGKALGFDLTAFAYVGLHSQAEADLNAFLAQIDRWPIVREAYVLSGEVDFLLKCVARDLDAFQHFIMKELTAVPNVDHVRTSLVLGVPKMQPGLPI